MKFTNSLKIKSDFALHVSCSPERICCDIISFSVGANETPIPHDELVSALAQLHRYVAEQLDISTHDLAYVISNKLDRPDLGRLVLKPLEIHEGHEADKLTSTSTGTPAVIPDGVTLV